MRPIQSANLSHNFSCVSPLPWERAGFEQTLSSNSETKVPKPAPTNYARLAKRRVKTQISPNLLAAVGLILTPIYLLSMLRQVFYGTAKAELAMDNYFGDANPREIFIALCLLIPIVGIGLYPKVATQTYDVKTVAVTAQVREALPVIAQEQTNLYSGKFIAPSLPKAKAQPLLGIVE